MSKFWELQAQILKKKRMNALEIENSNLCIKDFINIVYKYMSLHNGLNILTTSLRVGF